MPELPTFDELYAVGRGEVQRRNPELTDWSEGSNLDAMIGGGAVLADQVIAVVLALFAEQFVDTAEDEALDALAMDRFRLERRPASAAVGTLRFTRGSSSGALLIPSGTRVEAEVEGQRVVFETSAAGTISSGESSVDVEAVCSETGRQGNVAVGVVDDLLDAIPGDSGVTATNPERFAGGAPAEGNAAFRDRIRRYFQTLRKGTVDALQAGALTVPGVSYATIDESTVPPDEGGFVSVYIGDPDGSGNSVLAAAVEAELDNWRSASDEVRVFSAEREEISLAMTAYIRRGADRSTLRTAIRAAVLEGYVSDLAPNETLYLSKAESRAHGVSDAVRSVQVTSPSADRAPSDPYKALRVLPEAFELTFVEV